MCDREREREKQFLIKKKLNKFRKKKIKILRINDIYKENELTYSFYLKFQIDQPAGPALIQWGGS